MIDVPANYNTILAANHIVEYRIDLDGTSYYGEHILGGSVESGLYDQFTIGTAVSRILKFSTDLAGAYSTANLYFRLYQDPIHYTDWLPKGKYYVATQEVITNGTTEITCYDSMQKANAIYMTEGTWDSPYSDTLVSRIATRMGVTVDSATSTYLTANRFQITSGFTIGDEGTTMRNFLCYIGAVHCGGFIIDDYGKLKLWRYGQGANLINVGDNTNGFSMFPSVTVDRVVVSVDGNSAYYAPSGLTDQQWYAMTGKIMNVNIPFGTQTIANNLLSELSAHAFFPYNAVCAELNPAAELSDWIAIGSTMSVIAKRTYYLDSMGTSDVSADTENVVTDKYPYITQSEGKVERQLATMSSQLAVNTGSISAIVTNVGANGTVTAASIVTSINQTSGASTVKIDANHVEVSGFVTFSDLSTSGSSTINGNNITTGTITAEHIKLWGNMNLYKNKTDGKYIGQMSFKTITYNGTSYDAYGIHVLSEDPSTVANMGISLAGKTIGYFGSEGHTIIGGNTDVIIQGGYFYTYGSGTPAWNGSAYFIISDRRLKRAINYNNTEKMVALFDDLKPVSFRYKDDPFHQGSLHLGFIAQDVEESTAKVGLEDATWGINTKGEHYVSHHELVAACVAKIRQLENRIEELENG